MLDKFLKETKDEIDKGITGAINEFFKFFLKVIVVIIIIGVIIYLTKYL